MIVDALCFRCVDSVCLIRVKPFFIMYGCVTHRGGSANGEVLCLCPTPPGQVVAVAMAAAGPNTARASGSQRRGLSASSSGDGSDLGVESGSLDLDDPEAREALAVFLEDYEEIRKQEKREQGVAQYLDYVSAEAEAFAEENAVDDATMGEIISIIETGTYEYVAIEHAAKDGEMDWSEAKPQLKAIREEGKASLQALLGEEAYDEFESRVWGAGRD